MRPGLRRTVAVLAGAGALAAACVPQARAAVPEAAVKAAFLLKLGAFVTQGGAPLPRSVCTIGSDSVVESLPAVAGGPAAMDLRAIDGPEASAGCGLIYVASGSQRERVLQDARGRPVLVVSDGAGGVIGFVTQASRVRFAIDLRDARERGLEISSKLLSLAVSIRR